MPAPPSTSSRHFTPEAQIAAAEARAAKRAAASPPGLPELFIVRASGRTFTWELRRFGGVLLERGIETYSTQALARADGEAVLSSLCPSPDPSTFRRDPRWDLAPAEPSRD